MYAGHKLLFPPNSGKFTFAKKFIYRCKLYSETLVLLNIGLVGQIFRYFVLKKSFKTAWKVTVE